MKILGLVAILLIAVSAPSAFSQTAMSETKFRDYVIARMMTKQPDLKVEITGPLSFKVSDSIVHVGTGYDEYRKSPDQLSDLADKWTQMVLGVVGGDGAPDARDLELRLVHVARNKAYLEYMKQEGRTPENELVWRPLAGDLIALMMVDGETTMNSVSSDALAKAGLAIDRAWQLAGCNSATRLGELQIGNLDGNGPIALTAQSGLATGLLADENVCAAGPLADGAIVLVVDRNTFIIGRPDDPQSIGPFWAFAKPAIQKHELASGTPIACKNGKWTVVDVPR